MKTDRKLPLLLLGALSLLLCACGGGGGGGGSGIPKPAAVISLEPDMTVVELGTTLTFHGMDSHSPESSTLSYQWSLIQTPADSTAALTDAQTVTATLTPDMPGEWAISLIVNDGRASSNPAHKVITVTAPSVPLAIIKPLSGAILNLPIQLDGSASVPPNNAGDYRLLTFAWELTTVPEDSTAALDDTSAVWPRFTPDKQGAYTVSLTVDYNGETSAAVEQTIEVLADAAPPTAVAKLLTENPVRTQTVQLSAADSSDPQGNELHYFWSFGIRTGQPYPTTSGRPEGSQAVIDNPTSATPSFTPDVAGKYTLMLMAWSGKRSHFTEIEVQVGNPEGAANNAPVVVVPAVSPEAEPGIQYMNRVRPVDSSYDIDGDPLTKEWTLLEHPAGFNPEATTLGWTTDLDTTSGYSYFLPTHEGEYKFQLRVSDGINGWSEPVTQVYKILTGANVAPTAVIKSAVGNKKTSPGGAMLKSNAMVGQAVVLDGSASTGGNGDQVFYQWELAYRPPGSEAVLDSTTSPLPSFTADKEGPYLARLRVKDSYGLDAANQGEILITAKEFNSPPLLRPMVHSRYGGTMITPEQPILFEGVMSAMFSIEANALDPDGDEVDALLTLTSAPQGFVWPERSQWAQPPVSFNSTSTGENFGFIGFSENNIGVINVTGTYVFQLISSDAMDQSMLHTLSIPFSSLAEYPSLLLRAMPHIYLYGYGERILEDRRLFHLVFEGSTGVINPGTSASPWLLNQWGDQSNHTHYAGEDYADMAWLELRAPADKGYTIIDVEAFSEDPDVPVEFVGLQEGQVINAGEAHKFYIRVSKFEDRTDSTATYPTATWRFRVKEKPEWVFEASMILAGKWYQEAQP